MSIYKGTQLIAANGAPGQNGAPGADGINGNGVLVVATCTEISNNIDYNNTDMNSGRNYVEGNQSWCKVGGYRSGLGNAGQAADVFGYGCYLDTGTGVHIEGYGTTVGIASQGTHIEGMNNYVKLAGNGCHIEGHSIGEPASPGQDIFANGIEINKQGVHVEGFGHLSTPFSLSDGAHIGGYGVSSNSETTYPGWGGTPGAKIKTNPAFGAENTYIEAIGLKNSFDNYGNLGRVMRNDGCMAIKGDLTFTALGLDGNVITNGSNVDGVYTLGEIVKALIDAGILAPPL